MFFPYLQMDKALWRDRIMITWRGHNQHARSPNFRAVPTVTPVVFRNVAAEFSS